MGVGVRRGIVGRNSRDGQGFLIIRSDEETRQTDREKNMRKCMIDISRPSTAMTKNSMKHKNLKTLMQSSNIDYQRLYRIFAPHRSL